MAVVAFQAGEQLGLEVEFFHGEARFMSVVRIVMDTFLVQDNLNLGGKSLQRYEISARQSLVCSRFDTNSLIKS